MDTRAIPGTAVPGASPHADPHSPDRSAHRRLHDQHCRFVLPLQRPPHRVRHRPPHDCRHLCGTSTDASDAVLCRFAPPLASSSSPPLLQVSRSLASVPPLLCYLVLPSLTLRSRAAVSGRVPASARRALPLKRAFPTGWPGDHAPPLIVGGFSKIVPAAPGCANEVRSRPFTVMDARGIEHGRENALIRGSTERTDRYTQGIR